MCSLLFIFFVQDHSNVGAASLLFFLPDARRLLREMDDLGLETEQQRVKHEVDFYANLLSDPVAMQEWRQEVVAQRGRERNLEEIARELQITVTRQNITFIDCKFQSNTYGEKSDATNYGAIGVETDDNDLTVHGCIFADNKFGDINIVVSTIDHETRMLCVISDSSYFIVWVYCRETAMQSKCSKERVSQ
jgi:hypothetical protein